MTKTQPVATGSSYHVGASLLPQDSFSVQLPPAFANGIKIHKLSDYSDSPRFDRIIGTYYKFFSKAFPQSEERDSHALLKSLLTQKDGFEVVIFTKEKHIIGGLHILYPSEVITFPSTSGRIAFIDYLWISAKHRKNGLGQQLMRDVIQSFSEDDCLGVVAEIKDPSQMRSVDFTSDSQIGINPQGRLRFWSQIGFLGFDAPYHCPSNSRPGSVIANKLLAFCPIKELPYKLDGNDYLQLLDLYFTKGYLVEDFAKRPEFRSFVSNIRSESTIGFKSLVE